MKTNFLTTTDTGARERRVSAGRRCIKSQRRSGRIRRRRTWVRKVPLASATPFLVDPKLPFLSLQTKPLSHKGYLKNNRFLPLKKPIGFKKINWKIHTQFSYPLRKVYTQIASTTHHACLLQEISENFHFTLVKKLNVNVHIQSRTGSIFIQI